MCGICLFAGLFNCGRVAAELLPPALPRAIDAARSAASLVELPAALPWRNLLPRPRPEQPCHRSPPFERDYRITIVNRSVPTILDLQRDYASIRFSAISSTRLPS
jgi:hypothetical protein